MRGALVIQHKLLHPRRLFALFKILVFTALFVNLWLFAHEDANASLVRFPDGVTTLDELIEVYAQTIDTASWLLLLVLFELETSYLPDAYLRHRRVKWSLHGLRAVAALVVVNSVIGYAGKYGTYLEVSALGQHPCALVEQGWMLLTDLDQFFPLSTDNCADVAKGAVRLADLNVVAPPDVLDSARQLAFADVVNAMAWVLVVILLEMDVRLQLRGLLRGWILRVSTGLKLLTYATLFAAAVYWGLLGSFVDFWDAFLWLIAFVFIEMNIFQWQRETLESEHMPTVRS